MIDCDAVAVVVARDGRVPAGADEAVAEAGGSVVLVGDGELPSATRIWRAPDGASLAPALEATGLVILPASPDGRDLAPRLAAKLGRPLLSGAVAVAWRNGFTEADLLRVDGRVVVPVSVVGAAVATLWPGARPPVPAPAQPAVYDLEVPPKPDDGTVRLLEVVEPDPATMELAEARRVIGGGAGLVPEGASDDEARAIFEMLTEVAAALGASAGATRVVTDAGWMPYDRQIGTTGVTLRADLYVALGVSGATQHTGGLGDPHWTVSVNTDPSCPMTGMADLGLVADAPALLYELARRLRSKT